MEQNPLQQKQEIEEIQQVQQIIEQGVTNMNNLNEDLPSSNMYMQQVMSQQEKVHKELNPVRRMKKISRSAPISQAAFDNFEDSEDLSGVSGRSREGNNMREENFNSGVTITGTWRWKTVIVPPNMYVVHTRRGIKDPLHIGLGISFKFNPNKDSFLVVPSAMQTIVINANCICKELQGILVQAYVQWIIEDFETSYKRLDFSDVNEPMRVVNVQLREQAEAAIKDKVATMSIFEVLSDKQPIIEELSERLRKVAEGSEGKGGLGIKIVTVQIKEAVVSSSRLWENLQSPFRAQQHEISSLAKMEADKKISLAEFEKNKTTETAMLETDKEIKKLRDSKEAEEFDRTEAEELRRFMNNQEKERTKLEADVKKQEHTKELENKLILRQQQLEYELKNEEIEIELKKLEIQKKQINAKTECEMLEIELLEKIEKFKLEEELNKLKIKKIAEIEIQKAEDDANNAQIDKENMQFKAKQDVLNNVSQNFLGLQAIDSLPIIAEKLPKPKELKSVNINNSSGSDSLAGVIATIKEILSNFGVKISKEN